MFCWHQRGAMAEGEQWLAALLALPDAGARTTARSRALTGHARTALDAALVIFRRLGARPYLKHVEDALARRP
jgi:hypothetical protein